VFPSFLGLPFIAITFVSLFQLKIQQRGFLKGKMKKKLSAITAIYPRGILPNHAGFGLFIYNDL
jgi:hypothetical protein